MSDLVPLGRGGLRVSQLSFGAAAIGNLSAAISDDDAAAAIHAAWASGIRYFDVAPHYGAGLAEVRLGRALRQYPRDEYIISTKVGRRLFDLGDGLHDDTPRGFDVRTPLTRARDYSEDGARRSLDESLDRLGLDRIDVVYVHDADHHYRAALDGAFVALDDLRREGVITSYGAGMNQSAMLADFVRNTDADVMLAARTFTLMERGALSDLIPLATHREVSVVIGGVLTGIFAADGSRRILPAANRMAALCRRYGVSLEAAAIRFPLTNAAVASVLVGMRSEDEVRRNVAAMEVVIEPELFSELEREL